MSDRHAFQILEQLGPEADRLGIKVVDVYGQSGPASEFLSKIIRYIEAREAEIDRLRSLVRFQDGVIRSGDVACLTGEERAALERAIAEFAHHADRCREDGSRAATLRGLLERLGGSDGPVTEPMPFLRRD